MITFAEPKDAYEIHRVMLAAFEEYRYTAAPSSALDETAASIKSVLEDEKERALLYWHANKVIGALRFKEQDDALYFFRLSVRPEERGRKIARQLLSALADHAVSRGFNMLCCQVRLSVRRNMALYEQDGFSISDRKIVIKPDGAEIETVFMTKKL
ncbi:Acetyltransferase (GNAT) family protein [Terribacillus halophilus]|uniref:Acetyltransferase (GNAT) family protein n=1 Tax=Terribacillus halophilus TaxID=361279 RepID=A0A1G6JLR5_9BACI|nr:GNAT family N-acetyltransferase [Terribacillus halophilus]SDC19611.1 Acetyltransferase (GNAT) family protein [Terribacillus halophilus]